jgi:hypothetical protein
MRYLGALSLVAGSLMLPECASAQSDPALDRLFLTQSQHQPTGIILSFNSVTGVDNWSKAARLARAGCSGGVGSVDRRSVYLSAKLFGQYAADREFNGFELRAGFALCASGGS